MHAIRAGLLALLVPAAGLAQAAPPSAGKPAIAPPAYRGLTPGLSYAAFVERANALADHQDLTCNTSRQTAQLMECGVSIRDPTDGARFYLSGHFVEQNADVISLFDSAGFHDTRGPELVSRTRRDLTRVFGRPRRVVTGMWEWTYGRRVVRLNWRGRGAARWVSVMLMDYSVMDKVGRYLKPKPKRRT